MPVGELVVWVSQVAAVVPQAWHHLVLTLLAETVTVSLNGEVEIETEVSAGSSIARLIFGGDPETDPRFEGKIDEVAVYDHPLPSALLPVYGTEFRSGFLVEPSG